MVKNRFTERCSEMYLHNAHLTMVNNLKLENENVQLFSDVYYGEQNTVPVRMSL